MAFRSASAAGSAKTTAASAGRSILPCGIDDGRPEPVDEGLIGRPARLHHLPGDPIGVDEDGSVLRQQVGHGRFAGADPSGQSHGSMRPATDQGRRGREAVANSTMVVAIELVGHEEVVAGDAGDPAGVPSGNEPVGHGQDPGVGGDVPLPRDLVPEIEEVELEHLVGLVPPGGEVGLHVRDGVEALDLHVVEVPLEEVPQLGGLEEVDVEGVLEIGRGVGGEEEDGPVVGQYPGQLPDMALGVVEVLDQVRGTGPPEAGCGVAQGERVHLGHPETGRRPPLLGELHGVGAVVGPEHRPILRDEAHRLEPLAATHIEHGPVTQALDDRPVPGGMQGQERVGRDALHGTLTRQALVRGAGGGEPRGSRRCCLLPCSVGHAIFLVEPSWSRVPDRLVRSGLPGRTLYNRRRPVVYTTEHSCRIQNQFLGPPWPSTPRLRAAYAVLRSPSRIRSALDYTVIALFAFVPMLASQPGTVTDDTKTYLYLDPGRYIRQAVSLWDPNVALGTVTHENIGYVLPMGPFYWVLAELHVPLWIAQRLWMGAILFAAGAGVLYLCRTVGLTGPGRYVASLAYLLTPYVLQYSGRISVILLPWSGLPWMLAFVILALRRGGWRYPALFALVVALVSGINASSILYVAMAPILWLVYAVAIAKEATWRRAWGVAWRVALLTALATLWWVVGLQVEAAFGVNILKYTETVPATSATSLASEILRGLGYWYFYGSDRAGHWTQSSVAYTQNLWLIGFSFAVPVLSILAAVFVRWRHRAYFVLIVVVGMVLSVGAYPYANPSGVGSVFKYLMVNTTAGLAMRSTDRATPLVLMSLAVLLGAGVSALAARVRRTGLVVGAGVVGVVIAATTPLWTGAIIANGFTQPAHLPTYVHQAAAKLNSTHASTRVFAIPGNNFAAYRWGDTIDTVWPALLTRPFVTHEQQIMGSLPTANVLNAVDVPIQEGTMDWSSLAPMASLMSVGDVLVQYDQAYERYDIPDPRVIAGNCNPLRPGSPIPSPMARPAPTWPPSPDWTRPHWDCPPWRRGPARWCPIPSPIRGPSSAASPSPTPWSSTATPPGS